jgi:hypothetical protein
MRRLPTNKKESLQFGIIMCCGMVAVMSIYNMWMNGGIGHLTGADIAIEVGLGFVVALLLDLYIAGPLAKKVTLALPFTQSNKVAFVLCMSTSMIIGMVFFMSMFGLVLSYFHHSIGENSIVVAYSTIFAKNFILALPLQLLIMGPLVRFIFVKFVKKENRFA